MKPCPHKGEQVGSILSGCKACHGKPIFACDVHGRCCSTKQLAENVAVRACEGCTDFAGEISCPHLKRGCCELAARHAGIPLRRCPTTPGTCVACLEENSSPRSVTTVVLELARAGARAYDSGLVRS